MRIASRKSSGLLRLKVACHLAVAGVRAIAAWTLRRMPGSWALLGLPGRPIPSLRRWVEVQGDRTFDRWQGTRGPHYECLLGPVTVRRPAPKEVDGRGVPHELTADQHTIHPELFLAVLPGARVLGPNGTVITPDGRIVCESTWPRRYLADERAWTALSLPRCRRLPGRYYSIASPHSSGYYHWITEVLPRLFALDTLIGDDIRIFINAELNVWQRESLELLGLDAHRLHAVGCGYFQPELLYLPSFLGDPSPHPFACRWLRERLLPGDAPARRDRRLYVTRRRARCRRVVNEQEIEPILRDHGFEVVEAERLTFLEQVELFSGAEFVAGPHGAGLTNILFAPEHCKVLELFQPTYFLASTYKLATCVNHEYGFLTGEPAVSATSDSANTTDIRVDKDRLNACLGGMFEMRRGHTSGRPPRGRTLSRPRDHGHTGRNGR